MALKISIITTDYNIGEGALAKSLKKLEGFDYEIIHVTDSDDGDFIPSEVTRVLKPEHKIGYYNSLKFGLLQSTGDYVYFLSRDSMLSDEKFLISACEKLSEGSDMVFGRSQIVSEHGEYVMSRHFESSYSSVEFLKEWQNLRMIFMDYFSFSSILFRKEILMDSDAFKSDFPDALSLDTATLLKSVLLSDKISFVDMVACAREVNEEQVNRSDKSNMVDQVLNQFATPLDVRKFVKKKDISKELEELLKVFFNKYAEYAFGAVYSDYMQTKNDKIFPDTLDSIDSTKSVYLYGHGWVGLAFKKYLTGEGIEVSAFVDDFKTGDDIVKLDDLSKDSQIIIASYKCSDVFKIYKRLSEAGYENIIDMLVGE